MAATAFILSPSNKDDIKRALKTPSPKRKTTDDDVDSERTDTDGDDVQIVQRSPKRQKAVAEGQFLIMSFLDEVSMTYCIPYSKVTDSEKAILLSMAKSTDACRKHRDWFLALVLPAEDKHWTNEGKFEKVEPPLPESARGSWLFYESTHDVDELHCEVYNGPVTLINLVLPVVKPVRRQPPHSEKDRKFGVVDAWNKGSTEGSVIVNVTYIADEHDKAYRDTFATYRIPSSKVTVDDMKLLCRLGDADDQESWQCNAAANWWKVKTGISSARDVIMPECERGAWAVYLDGPRNDSIHVIAYNGPTVVFHLFM